MSFTIRAWYHHEVLSQSAFSAPEAGSSLSRGQSVLGDVQRTLSFELCSICYSKSLWHWMSCCFFDAERVVCLCDAEGFKAAMTGGTLFF